MNFLKNFLLFSLILLVFSACSEKEVKKDTITFWHFWSEPYQKSVLDSIIDEFEKQENITVETTELSWNDGKTKLFAAFNSKTAPDVLELGSDWVAQFSSGGVLKELNTESIGFSKFIEFSLEPSYWNGKAYATPWVVDSRVMFINNDLLLDAGASNSLPVRYSQLLENAQKVNKSDGNYGFAATGSDEHRLYKKIVSMFWSNGGIILDKYGKPAINSKENIEALEMYLTLSQSGYIETQKALDNKFAQGNIAYAMSGSWLIEKIKNINPDLNYTVALVPGFEGKPGISFAGGEYLAISEQTNNSEAAEKFIKFMTNGKNSIEFCKRINAAGFPADKNYFDDDFYKSYPKRLVFGQQLQFAKMTPVHPKWLEIEKIIETAAVKVLYGEASSKDALDEAQEELEMLLE
jgi:multiple sugar transport system substrate-binding protein